MSRHEARAAALCLIVLFLGCATGSQSDLETDWLGHSYKDLQASFGDPIVDMPEGHLRLVVFEELVPMLGPTDQVVWGSTPAIADSTGRTAISTDYVKEINESQLYEVRHYFWLDENGKVVRAETRTP